MNWDALSTIAEMISAVAVVVSLLYVGRQIHQSNRLSQAATFHTINADFTNAIAQLHLDSSLAEIHVRVQSGEQLSDVDITRYESFLTTYFVFLENAHVQQDSGLFVVELGTAKITDFMAEYSAGFLNSEQTIKWWLHDAKKFISPEFHTYATKQMALKNESISKSIGVVEAAT